MSVGTRRPVYVSPRVYGFLVRNRQQREYLGHTIERLLFPPEPQGFRVGLRVKFQDPRVVPDGYDHELRGRITFMLADSEMVQVWADGKTYAWWLPRAMLQPER